MYIQERIVSRKILVISIYEQIIQSTPYDDSFVFIQEKVDTQRYHFPVFNEPDNLIEHMGYMIEWFFDKKKKHTLDIPYLRSMIYWWDANIDRIISTINTHCTTFNFEKMDPIDKSIFLAGSIEYIIHQTTKQILLNEMIEIAKRYGDEWSSKLINGIAHKVIDSL